MVLAVIVLTSCGISGGVETANTLNAVIERNGVDTEISDINPDSDTANTPVTAQVSTVAESDSYFDEVYEKSLLPYVITYETVSLSENASNPENGISAAELESLVKKHMDILGLVLWDPPLWDKDDSINVDGVEYYHIIEPRLSSVGDWESMVYEVYTGGLAKANFSQLPVMIYEDRLYTPVGGMSGQAYKKEYGVIMSNENECVVRFCDSFGEWEADFTFVRTEDGWRISKIG